MPKTTPNTVAWFYSHLDTESLMNGMLFELGLPGEKTMIQCKKPTVETTMDFSRRIVGMTRHQLNFLCAESRSGRER